MSIDGIKSSLEKYKRKFYYKQLSKGLLLTLSFFLALFIGTNSLESLFWFNNNTRLVLLIFLVGAFLIPFVALVVIPALELLRLKKGITEKQMATDIGRFFPEVSDKLLNLLELNSLNYDAQSLIAGSIKQKEEKLKVVDFSDAIDLKVNLKYLYGLLAILCVLGLLSFVNSSSISESTNRILKFQQNFDRPMPFKIEILNPNLSAFKNEDFTINIHLTGESIPESLFLKLDNRKIKFRSDDKRNFTYTWVNMQNDVSFQIGGAGFFSKEKEIKIISRPEITNFILHLDYPKYTKLEDEKFRNIGSASIPEGTNVSWHLNTVNAESVKIALNDATHDFQVSDNQLFTFYETIFNSQQYRIDLENINGRNKTPIQFNLEVIPDRSPEILVNYTEDSVFFSSLIISGKIEDDYGFSSLRLFQKKVSDGTVSSKSITFNRNLPEQRFIYHWNVDSALQENEALEIWVAAWDNDQVNGAKKVVSNKYYYRKPNEKEIEKLIAEKSSETEKGLSKSKKQSNELNEQLQELENRLRNKKEIGWQEQKLIQDILSKKEEIEKSIEELKSKHEELISSQVQFDKKSQKIAEKSQQLQKLMEELLDDETKALYDELQKLLEEKSGLDEVSEQLSKIRPNEQNLEQELERALELFKKLKLETKIEETAKKLNALGEEQEQLAKQENVENAAEEQEKLNERFEELKEGRKEIEELNQELENPEPLDDFKKQEDEIQEELDEIQEELEEKGDNKKTKSKQENAGNKMKQMAGNMQQMQSNMEMEMMEENLEDLRDILDNLIKTSFEQENIIKNFRGVSQSDPRFLELSQDQLRLVENSKVIEDSLRSLASRVLQISNFVTREIDQINRSLENALKSIKERNIGSSTSHQQFAMTSMNNLALLLDDVMQQMQMAMSKGGSGDKKGKKKGQKPSMSQLQQQLSQQIQDLKKSGKSGRQLSEELAKMAAEQARIRQQLEELQKKLGGQDGENDEGRNGNSGLKEAIEKMEQNEVDLVNKRLTQNLINRQKDIISRMLETEKSMREQDQDKERKGETANQVKRVYPPAFEEYLKARQSEIELLNSIPLDLNPFYKREVNKYFRKLSVQEN